MSFVPFDLSDLGTTKEHDGTDLLSNLKKYILSEPASFLSLGHITALILNQKSIVNLRRKKKKMNQCHDIVCDLLSFPVFS